MAKRPTTRSAPERPEPTVRSQKTPSGEGVAFITRVNFSATLSLASFASISPSERHLLHLGALRRAYHPAGRRPTGRLVGRREKRLRARRAIGPRAREDAFVERRARADA